MRFFFRSRQFKMIIAVFLSVLIVSLSFALAGKRMAPYTDLAAIITAPFRSMATAISNGVKDTISAFNDGNELMLKNNKLQSEVDDLHKKIADYDKVKSQNDFYKNYLEIKELNPDYKFAPATVISRDNDDSFKGFLINKGSASGIAVHDPVISDAGLIGYISEIGTTTAKVTTILNPDITLGALDSRTSDSGIISGNIELSKDGLCRFSNLARTSKVAIGDYIITSGEGIFPDGLLVGTISSIGSDKYNSSIYADIEPFVNFSSVRKVMVITDFDGKGGLDPSKEGK